MRRLLACLLALVVLLVCAACAALPAAQTTIAPASSSAAETDTLTATASATTTFSLTITDAVSQTFHFDKPPRIGCYWYGCMEMLADLGVRVYAAGMTPEETTSVFYSPVGPPLHLLADDSNPEQWAAAEIDLLLTRVPADAANDALKAAAPIFYLHHPSYGASAQKGYQAYIENLRLLGQLTGKTAEADAAIARFETVLKNLKHLSTPEIAKQQVAVLFQSDTYSGLTPDNPFCVALADAALGQCIKTPDNKAWLETNPEQFFAIDPDWIVYMVGEGESYKKRTDPVWPQLKAVKAGHVYDAKGNRYYCCSTRGLIHALQEYAHYVLPAANISDPGVVEQFDPLKSPLVKP